MAEKSSKQFNLGLNGYRGLCAFLVFLFHLGSAGVVMWPGGTPAKDWAHLLWTSCMYGVEMFFMISGYVILGSLLRHATVGGFLRDRFIRIFSAWVPALLAVSIVCWALHMKMFANVSLGHGLTIVVANLFLLPPLIPLPTVHQGSWSLTYEWMFYLVAASGALLFRAATRRFALIAIWALIAVALIWEYPRAVFFVTGVLVFHYRDWLAAHKNWLRAPVVSLLVFLVAWHFAQLGDNEHDQDTMTAMMENWRWVPAIVAFVAALHMFGSVCVSASRQTAFLSTPLFQWLGGISYSFYLWHALVMSLVKRIVIPYVTPVFGSAIGLLVFGLASLAIALPLAWASSKLLEGRLAGWMRTLSFFAKKDAKAPVVTRDISSQGRASAAESRRLRCLWIGRYIPYPLDAGAKVYSAQLAESLAREGVMLRFAGFGDTSKIPSESPVEWIAVSGEKRSNIAGLLSTLPIAASIDATPAYKTLLREQLSQPWDMICLDGYGTGWALPMCEAHVRNQGKRRPVLIHVSHNHEERLWQSMARDAKVSIIKRIVLWQNYRKVRALERRVVRRVDLVTTISDEDNQSLGPEAANTVVLTPGFQGRKRAERKILAATPRHVALVGSFRWVMKQENLRQFVQLADPVFAREGITLDVVGDVPDELLKELQPACRATKFHGFVEDIDAVMDQARMAVVPEVIGGGFKLKFLDYMFARVPVATLAQASAGLPQEIRRKMVERDTLAELVQAVVTTIDQIERLNDMQQGAFIAASALFDWKDRGQKLLAAASQLSGDRGAMQSAQSRKSVAKLVESATPV